MDLVRIIAQLRQERESLNQAILILEQLQGVTVAPRRGRPPRWLQQAREANLIDEAGAVVGGKRGKKRSVSAATRRKMAEAQRRRWAQRSEAKPASKAAAATETAGSS